MSADPGKPKVLQDVQKLGLQSQRQLCDLVEIDRASVRVLELSRLAPMRASEGPLLMTEELRLEQSLRDRRAVDLHEGGRATCRCRVDRPRYQIFAHAALAANQDSRVGISDTLDNRANDAHPRMTIEEGNVVDETVTVLLRQRSHR